MSIPMEEVLRGAEKLEHAGVTRQMWHALLQADAVALQQVVASWPRMSQVYDACSILGFGSAKELVQIVNPGETGLRYAGWSLRELREEHPTYVRDRWFDDFAWGACGVPSGFYVVRFRVEGSDGRTCDDQQTLVPHGCMQTPVVLGASAMLAAKLSGIEDPPRGHWIRCRERSESGRHVVLGWDDDRLSISDERDDLPSPLHWLSVTRPML